MKWSQIKISNPGGQSTGSEPELPGFSLSLWFVETIILARRNLCKQPPSSYEIPNSESIRWPTVQENG
jgi:hypothetical protein